MADYKLSYTGDQTDEALGKAMKAVLTEAQNLTPAQQEQARENIGAGTSNFSGSYNDLTDKPDVEKGPKGDPGVTPDLQIGTVTTGEEGTEASANITGTAEKPYLNLVLPRGATGPQGEPGSDASVTKENVVSALGYTPADIPHQFHLIQETTVESDVSVIQLTDLNLKEIYVLFIQPSTGYAAINLDTTIYFSKAVGGSPSIYGWWSIMGAAASQESMGYVQVRGRLLDAAFQQMQNYKMMQTNPRVLKYIVEEGTTLTGIRMTANAAKYPVGMVVRIYGVDA